MAAAAVANAPRANVPFAAAAALEPYGEMISPYGKTTLPYGATLPPYGPKAAAYDEVIAAYGATPPPYGARAAAYGEMIWAYGARAGPEVQRLARARSRFVLPNAESMPAKPPVSFCVRHYSATMPLKTACSLTLPRIESATDGNVMQR